MIEIERKFLVKSEVFQNECKTNYYIAQGYLNTNPARTVRVRIKGEKAYLTIKGIGSETGLTRFEWEKEISVIEAKALLQLCEKGIIEKTRYEIPFGNHLFEVDVFHGENQGLILAEIELQSETELFEKPDWIDKEVSADFRYFNSYLSQHPFATW